MAAKKKKANINLIPQDDYNDALFGRILLWTVGTFRYIVIVVELVVMSAFLSRFWLDAKSTDLNDEIKQKEGIITASKSFEDEFRLIQKRLKTYSDYASQTGQLATSLSKITSLMPEDSTKLKLKSFTYKPNTVGLQAAADSEQSIEQFLVNLHSVSQFTKVSLGEITTNPKNESELFFTVNINLKV